METEAVDWRGEWMPLASGTSFLASTVRTPSLVVGSVGTENLPVGSPPTAFQAGVLGWSLSVTVRLATMTFTRFSGTSPKNCNNDE
ncbi:hypothetical protein EYF80_059664 [Liparis tanakae]|uniref:Uncharacterized protein n=1 Tax=Liparis tanakae TaxID=230148 RepID=A0A4Z2EMS1_9TELE|nr:hypothetical protein EYF80_059664 [Liparis tanakae]